MPGSAAASWKAACRWFRCGLPFHGFHRGLRLPEARRSSSNRKETSRPEPLRPPLSVSDVSPPTPAARRRRAPVLRPVGGRSGRKLVLETASSGGKSLADDARPWTGRPCRFPTMDDQRPPEPDIAGCFLGRATPPCARGHIATVEIRSLLRGRPLGRPECPRVKVWGRVPRRAGLSEGGVGQNGRMRVASGRRVRSLWCWRPARPKQGRLHCASRGAAKRR